MGDKNFEEYMEHMDIGEVLMIEHRAMDLLQTKGSEDALAYAMAASFKSGWKAHEKKMQENNKEKE